MIFHLPGPRRPFPDFERPANRALKLSVWPVTALAATPGGRGTGPSYARAAPGHPAAYPKRCLGITVANKTLMTQT